MELAQLLIAEGYSPVGLARSRSGLLEVPAKVAGSPAVFCLDTGAIRTCFDGASARRLGLCARPADEPAAGGAAGEQAMPCVALPGLSLGRCALPTVEACVVDLEPINEVRRRRGDRPFDGLLGSDLLLARAAVLDYGSMTLHLREAAGTGSGPDLARFFAAEGRLEVKLQRSRSGLLDLPARVGGSSAILSLDTGAGQTCLDRAAVQRLALPTRPSTRRALGIAVADENLSYADMRDLSIGPCPLPQVEAVVTDFGKVNAYRAEQGDGPLDGLLGTDILAARAAVLDYGALTLYLRRGNQDG